MRFGILTQWFDPEPGGGALPGALARELAARGHEVTVITGFPNYPTGRLYPGYAMKAREDREQESIRIRRVALYPSHDASVSHRLLNYVSFAVSSSVLGLSALRKFDAIWVYNSPASIALPMWVAKYIMGIPHVLHLMDLWPDSILFTDFGIRTLSSRIAQSGLTGWCNAMYRSAASVAYVSPSQGNVLAERGVAESKLHYVPVWADPSATNQLATAGEDNGTRGKDDQEGLSVLYAGALGPAQGLEDLITAIRIAQDSIHIHCVIAGSGTSSDRLRELVDHLGLTNIQFVGQVPRQQIGTLMNEADVHVVTLKRSDLSRITMPSKIQNTLARKKPFIAVLEGDARAVAERSGAAFLAEPGDPMSIALALIQASRAGKRRLVEMGESGLKYYNNHFALEIGVNRIEELLTAAAAK